MPIQLKPPPKPASPGELTYLAEHLRDAGIRNASYEQLLAPALPLYQNSHLAVDPGLTEAEVVAIYEYTTDAGFIERFNALMRDDLPAAMEVHGGFINVLGNALAKLPSYEGQVWRGSGILPPPLMGTLTTAGDIFCPGYFWSTAHDPRGLEEYPDVILFDIQSRMGKNIAWLSAKGKDYEVLFPPAAAFRVTYSRRLAFRKWRIWLTDLGQPHKEA